MSTTADYAAVDGAGSVGGQEKAYADALVIPRPETKDQLEQLLYRYRAIIATPEKNQLEIDAIEQVFTTVSEQQELYVQRLAELRKAVQRDVGYDSSLLKKQLISLQLLSRDMDLPVELLQDLETVLQPQESSPNPPTDIKPIQLSLDFTANAEKFGLKDKFCSIGYQKTSSKLGEYKMETAISARIAQRIHELETLPSNLGTYSLDDALEFITKGDVPSSIDNLKIKALVELKALKLLTKQKSLRQKLISNVTSQSHQTIPYLRDSQYTMAAQRSINVRMKVIVPQTARLAEELERQQLLEKRKRERNLHRQKVSQIVEFIQQRQQDFSSHRERAAQFGRICATLHSQMEKEEQRRIERTAKQRLAALKSNDEEAYLKLLDQTKDTRITHLLKQTNSFLDSLAQAVRVQQNEAKLRRGEEIPPVTDEEREKIDYYEVAHRIKEKVEKQPSILVGGTLKEYQIRGLEWMVSLYNNHLNGILADEMGLGKTIQSISLITYLYEVKKDSGPFLVIVPLSTITNWTLEFEKWAPSLTTVIYKGTPNQRRSLQHQVRIGDFDVLLTTYEYIIKDRSLLAKHEWSHMIIDEGHRMKNAQSKLSYTLTHYYKTRHRLILTGTPLQNNLPELWALLNFVLPKIFNSSKTFDEWFNTPFSNTGGQEKLELTEEEALLVIRRLHKVLRPFLLRRLKKEVEKDLPDKVEKVVKCKLSGLQHQLYQQMLKHNALFVGAGTEGATKGGIKGLNNKIMQLRKICNHPFVFDEVEGVVNPTRTNSSLLYRVSGKFELLDRVLPKFKATGHRVLMFFQMTQVMDIMEDFLQMKNLKYMRLDGATKAEERTGMLNAFNAPDSDYFCFLLSTRAGGLGLNLQTADTVIIFDTDWNPHQDLQAQDRAHRIGQKNEVRILRLITTDSVEEVILERAMQKLDIDGKVIQAGKFDNKSTAEEQEAFLRRLLESESNKDDDDQAELDDVELNEILARNEAEKELFDKIDRERVMREQKEAAARGLKKSLPRLITLEELPDVFTEDIEQHLQTGPTAVGRIRERKRVYYDDGLTEEQWLQAVDDDNDTLEEAIKRKREAREKRQRKKMGLDTDGLLDETPEPTTPADAEPEPLPEEPVVSSKRPRRPRKASEALPVSGEHEPPEIDEPEPKKPKLKVKINLPKLAAEPQPKKRTKKPAETLLSDVQAFIDLLRQQTDPTDGHSRTDIFEKLPSRRDYPDYYQLIANPVSIDTILRNTKKGVYTSMVSVRSDFQTMFDNAKFYNQEGSWVYNDADYLSNFLSTHFPGRTDAEK
ncbi:AER375Cp [Eremothecium gossypii ATCC 10895]|uniref:AER375Cp n=1 Tax=Eremothecium gossypii (strain ATCC 10895 / CBS 109.51 / FGSC 9923 / NRRL Y-1056) TaxID=284811 RepID=Q755Z2_EREGS|nr:AER375Cp [Eremothecium gossypii ATCC 10895]AAS53055.1 AER375Cp [Eremothecium gossypii ATCC 10895]